MRFRQIDPDFHTSGQIEGIGSRFDPTAFASAWTGANVESVTLFSKCCHGWSCHPMALGSQHPHLSVNLLHGQIDALHAVRIRTPIYLTANWDNLAAFRDPGWRSVTPEGIMPLTQSGRIHLDFCEAYLDCFAAQVDDVMTVFPDGDGLFIDMAIEVPSMSAATQVEMDAAGLDWTDPEDRTAFAVTRITALMDRITTIARRHNPQTPVVFYAGHVSANQRQTCRRHFSHIEIESLPTAHWGYEYFPLAARHVDPPGVDFPGMTGKLHYHWGETGAWKKPEALMHECGAMLTQGARCSIRGHLHPHGVMDATTIATIAPAYAGVRDREAGVIGSQARRQIALLTVESTSPMVAHSGEDPRISGLAADEGAVRVLLEGQFIFDVIDPDADLTGYELLILPDLVVVGPALSQKINSFVAAGGRVLLTGKSGIDPDEGFRFDLGGVWDGPAVGGEGVYVLPQPDLRAKGISDPLFVYASHERAHATDGLALGALHAPLMQRNQRGFSGHRHAPVNPAPLGDVFGLSKGGFVWLAPPVFSAYRRSGTVALLEIIENTIRFALSDMPLVTASLPRAGRLSLRHQPAEGRQILHLVHATPVLRGAMDGNPVQPIEDIVTLRDIAVSLTPLAPVAEVRTVPEYRSLPFAIKGNRIAFTVPSLHGHQMIACHFR